VDIVAARATTVDAPGAALDLDLLGMTLVSHEERPYGGFLMTFFYHVVVAHDESTRPPLVRLISLAVAGCTTGSPRPLVPMLSCCGTRFLASTPPRVAPSLWVWGSVACSAVRCIRLPGGYEARQGDVLRKHFTLRVVI
jgi:hypothetical protein